MAIVKTLAASGAVVAVVDPSSGDVAEARVRIRSKIQNDDAAREIVQQSLRSSARSELSCLQLDASGRGLQCRRQMPEWSEVIHDNLTAAHLVCRAAYPGLKATRGNVVLLGIDPGARWRRIDFRPGLCCGEGRDPWARSISCARVGP